MLDYLHVYLFILLMSASLHFAIGLIVLLGKIKNGIYASGCMFSISIYQLGYAMELQSSTLSEALFWSNIQYIGIPYILVFWTFFTFSYATQSSKSFPKWIHAVWLIPFSVMILHWTDSLHGLVYKSVEYQIEHGKMLLSIKPGPIYWFQLAIHYLCTMVAAVVMVRYMIREKRNHFTANLSLSVMTILPFLGLFFYLFRWSNIDPSPLTLAVAGPLFAFALLRLRIFSLSILGRDSLFEELGVGLVVLDGQKRITDCNEAWNQILHQSKENVLGKSIEVVFAQYKMLEFPQNMDESLIRMELKLEEADSFFEVTVRRLNKANGWTLVFHDITERKRMESKLAHMSFHDGLTGLYNRTYYQEELSRLQAAREFPLGLLVIDLDGLKYVNDHYGHAEGDQYLQRAAKAITNALREGDIAARIGGDEFQILIPRCETKVIQNVLLRLQKSFVDAKVEASFGVAISYRHDETLAALHRADELMYTEKNQKKKGGTNGVHH